MMFQVQVISKETIKPSSTTPDHLRHYQLSFLDQIAPPMFMPMVYFYSANSGPQFSHNYILHKLKQSLSETLVRFYPLAGRIEDNLCIDCNDHGVPWVEAHVNCRLSEVVQDPDHGQLNKLLPFEVDDVKDLVLAVQINFFDCGGIGVSVCISHKIADALSFFSFVNSWAAIARGNSDTAPPQFGSATLFPPISLSGFTPGISMIKENIVTKRFIFSASVLAALKAKYSDATTAEYPRSPSRIEALSAFIWSRFKAATQENPNPNTMYTMLHSVNLRTRIDPALPDNYFGNISHIAVSAVPYGKEEEEWHGALRNVRAEIRKINGDYVRKLQESGKGHLNFLKERAGSVTRGEAVLFSFSSLCRFPIYEANFGWGRPIWVGSASLALNNLIVFIDTSTGDGIEAWVNLKREDMAKFERDEELLSFVSPTPNADVYAF